MLQRGRLHSKSSDANVDDTIPKESYFPPKEPYILYYFLYQNGACHETRASVRSLLTPFQKSPIFHQKSPIFYITFYTRKEAVTKQEHKCAHHLYHSKRVLFPPKEPYILYHFLYQNGAGHESRASARLSLKPLQKSKRDLISTKTALHIIIKEGHAPEAARL